jgi:hypothetical protein
MIKESQPRPPSDALVAQVESHLRAVDQLCTAAEVFGPQTGTADVRNALYKALCPPNDDIDQASALGSEFGLHCMMEVTYLLDSLKVLAGIRAHPSSTLSADNAEEKIAAAGRGFFYEYGRHPDFYATELRDKMIELLEIAKRLLTNDDSIADIDETIGKLRMAPEAVKAAHANRKM